MRWIENIRLPVLLVGPALAGLGILAAPADTGSAQEPKPGRAIHVRRVAEPKEGAFTLLVPNGWLVEGGIFRINPLVAGGPFNSMWPKCDLTVKKDRAGTVLIRILPGMNYADFSHPRFAIQRQLHPPGSKYQGGLVRPLPPLRDFLTDLFQQLHPQANPVKEAQYYPLPELAQLADRSNKAANDALQRLGLPTISTDAGVLLAEYEEGGIRYKEALITAITDGRGLAAYWNNCETIQLRAPSAETARWQPVMEVIARSVEINPTWFQRQVRQTDKLGKILADAAASIRKDQQQLWENRQKIMERIDTDWMLYRTGQADYVNPYTNQVERDTSAWQYRWVTRTGEIIYSDDPNYNPNADSGVWNQQWQQTPVQRP